MVAAKTQTSLHVPDIPSPPEHYDHQYMLTLVNVLSQALINLSHRRQLLGTTVNLSNLPTSATGLRSGDLWYDTANSDQVKIVP